MINHSKTKATPKIRWLLCTLLFLALFIPVTLQATEGDTWIVFDCNRPNPNVNKPTYWDIWKLDPEGDGSQSSDSLFGVALTNEPSNEWDPTYSVEDRGGSVVFVSDKDGYPHLYKISIDGGSWSRLTFGTHANVDPCYSFDGTKIAYTSNQNDNWEIYIMDSDGYGIPERITHSFSDNRSPCFSTNGDKVYFVSNRDTDNSTVYGDGEIYVADITSTPPVIEKAIVDGSDEPLLLGSTERDPCCSPTDPNIIVFATNVATPTYTDPGLIDEADIINFELFSYNFVTKDTNRLTKSWNEYQGSEEPVSQLWNSSMPCFSPNGQHIAWSADNWACTGWLGDYSTRPFDDDYPSPKFYKSYWKPNKGQGSSHNIWIRPQDQNDHAYYFPPSYWGWDGGLTIYKHHHHKNYNPSWDEQP